jgi:hypothetical protein
VDIRDDAFYINDRPTYEGRFWRGMQIEGLLLNARLVQGVFDDRNPETRAGWDYPDGQWDPERNTREFIAAMPTWRRCGLLGFTINLQGGSPMGYSKDQPWHNSAFESDGTLREDYRARMGRIIERADDLGMAVILGYFYFGQDQRLTDEDAVLAATDNATDWICEHRWSNVLIEIANECNVRYDHEIIRPGRSHELIRRVQERSQGRVPSSAGRLLTSISYGGGTIPTNEVAEVSDMLLIHGNGVSQTDRIREMVDNCRALSGYHGQPIVFNEDDHFDFDKGDNNFIAAVSKYASWGYFDYRMEGEGFEEGYQSVPVDWSIGSQRKKGFFSLLADMTGQPGLE